MSCNPFYDHTPPNLKGSRATRKMQVTRIKGQEETATCSASNMDADTHNSIREVRVQDA